MNPDHQGPETSDHQGPETADHQGPETGAGWDARALPGTPHEANTNERDANAPSPASPPTKAPPRASRRATSLVLVATGDGKGKTTAAMGTALRALARGWRVCVVQFVKSGSWASGEAKVLSQLGADWHTMGDGFTWDSDDLGRSAEIARSAWQLAKTKISSGEFRLVVLDEVTYPLNWGWVPEEELITAIEGRPAGVNIFITGRDAPACLVALADTVSEVRKLKHAYEAGVMALKGIDF